MTLTFKKLEAFNGEENLEETLKEVLN